MGQDSLNTTRKALAINMDDTRYGTFAEIGAGQEVARHFFQAGRASHTIAKTISAYDMTFSDEIYGKADRYVSQPRLIRMLDHEFDLLNKRLSQKRGDNTCFFAFADTVATSSKSEGAYNHGWLGVRFQNQPRGPSNDVILHVQLLDRNRLQQQEALSILGVNLLHAAFHHLDNISEFLQALVDDLGSKRVEINLVEFSGPDTAHIDNRLVSLEAIRLGLTHAALFDGKGKVILGADALFKKPVLVQRGTFRPVTNVNVEIHNNALRQMKTSLPEVKDAVGILEVTLQSLEHGGKIDVHDFMDRVDAMSALGHHVMVSDFAYFYELKSYLRRCTDNYIIMVIGASHLAKLFDERYYKDLPGGILNAFGKLYDEKTQMYVYPFKSAQICMTSQTFNTTPQLAPLFQYLIKNKMIVDILGCDNVDTSIHSSNVREMLASNDPKWEELVPSSVCNIIKERRLFGYKG